MSRVLIRSTGTQSILIKEYRTVVHTRRSSSIDTTYGCKREVKVVQLQGLRLPTGIVALAARRHHSALSKCALDAVPLSALREREDDMAGPSPASTRVRTTRGDGLTRGLIISRPPMGCLCLCVEQNRLLHSFVCPPLLCCRRRLTGPSLLRSAVGTQATRRRRFRLVAEGPSPLPLMLTVPLGPCFAARAIVAAAAEHCCCCCCT